MYGLYTSESTSDDLARCRDHGERIGVDLLDLLAKADGIDAVANGVDHGLIRAAEAADDLMRGNAVVELTDNEGGNLVGLFGDDDEVFAAVDVIDDTVNEEGFCEQTCKREESDFHAERDKGAQTDEQIRVQERLTYVQAGIFFEDQRYDIRTAGGGGLREHDRGACRCQNDGVDELKEGLCRQRFCDGNELFQNHGKEGERQTAIGRADARFLTDEDEADEKKQNVDHGDPRCGGEDRERFTEHRTDTADTARNEAVGDLEEIYADGQKNNADGHEKITENDLYKLLLFFHVRYLPTWITPVLRVFFRFLL